jgi:RNA polymerase sigma-70 factor (sigma-E family)
MPFSRTAATRQLTQPTSKVLARDDEFQQFASLYLPTLLKAAYLLVRDADLAEDVVQGTLLRVFRQWADARQAPEAYSRVTLVNLCRDHWRRLRSRPREVPTDGRELATDRHPEFFGEAWAERKALEEALRSLGHAQREVLVLRFFLDLSVSETAEALGIAEGTVKSTTHRGLEQLRGLLKADEEVANHDR